MTSPEPQAQPQAQPQPQATLSDEANRLHEYLQTIDPDQEGVGLNKVRPIYPRVGWSVIRSHVQELVDAGKLSEVPVVGNRGKVSYNKYTWL